MSTKTTMGPFTPQELNRSFYVNAPLAVSVALIPPAVFDSVHWGVSFEMHNPNCTSTAIFDTEQEAQAVIDAWRAILG